MRTGASAVTTFDAVVAIFYTSYKVKVFDFLFSFGTFLPCADIFIQRSKPHVKFRFAKINIRMKILITGHNGFIGRNMMSWMLNEGWDVHGWSIGEEEFPKVEDYQWVVHLGAVTNPNERDVDRILKLNLEFSQELFKKCQQEEVHFQYASTYQVYGNTKDFTESSMCYPDNPYAWSKYLFDRWVFRQPNYHSYVQGFRYFNVYGKYMHYSKTNNVISKWRFQARNNKLITVSVNAEHTYRDWVWVGDICKLHIDFIKNVKGSGIWNCGTGLCHSDLDIAEEIAEQEDF